MELKGDESDLEYKEGKDHCDEDEDGTATIAEPSWMVSDWHVFMKKGFFFLRVAVHRGIYVSDLMSINEDQYH